MSGILRIAKASVFWASFLTLAGCGDAEEKNAYKGDRGTVTGKITLDGKAVPEGTNVLFMAPQGGYTATGVTKADGTYALSYNGTPKLPAVAYKVQLGPPTAKPSTSTQPADPLAKPVEAPPPPFPAKYTSTATSGLEYTVKAGDNTADFPLTP